MTVFLPLDTTAPLPASPPFLVESTARTVQLANAIKAIIRARRIVVISGAGISVQAGIPDFRSPEGLFQSLKRDHPRDVLASGKDLFDASVFKSEQTTTLFCQMITQLSVLSKEAQPTPFHRLLHSLDNSGKLLRVYTQNIDALESKAGLSFGVPEFGGKVASGSRLPTPPTESPRCIPLHGTLQNVHCQICSHSFPLDDHLPSFSAGLPPHCPECTSVEKARKLDGKRTRGVGKLRPSVVLYNETHKNGEGVGEAVRRDLVGSSKGKGRSGADLLLVVGTSLRVPGTKRMVREFSKATKSRLGPDDEPASKAIYLNLDFPVPTREWEGVFDTWIQGDAQDFADLLQVELDKEVRQKDAAKERKRKREENPTPKKQKPTKKAKLSPQIHVRSPSPEPYLELPLSYTFSNPPRTPPKGKVRSFFSLSPTPTPPPIKAPPSITPSPKLLPRTPTLPRRRPSPLSRTPTPSRRRSPLINVMDFDDTE